MTLEDHAEDLASDLGVNKEEVTDDLGNLVAYDIPIDEAKQSLRRKYGDDSDSPGAEPPSKDVAEIETTDSNVSVTAVILTAGKRSIRYQGEDQVIYEGEMADESGKLSYTAWDEFGLEPGQTVRVGNADVREWDDRPELNLGQTTSVEPSDEELQIDHEVGGDESLTALEPGDRGINVEVGVVECNEKIIDGRDGDTEILSGVLGDESARLPFTDWDPHSEIDADESVRIENVYVREFRGVPSINVSRFSTVHALDREVGVSESTQEVSVREAVESDGMFDVELVGNVIDIRDGSGLIERCPECGRIAENGQCRSHGDVDGEDDLRTKAILDDGTGTVTVILDEPLTEEIYGGDINDAKDHARDAMDRGVVADRIADRIVGKEFRIRGSLSVDDFGANLNATDFDESDESDEDPAARAEALLAEVDP